MSALRPYFEDDKEYERFMKAFWKFFDSQTPEFRKQYNEHKSDMAELYFFNKVWKQLFTAPSSKMVRTRASQA